MSNQAKQKVHLVIQEHHNSSRVLAVFNDRLTAEAMAEGLKRRWKNLVTTDNVSLCQFYVIQMKIKDKPL